VACGLTAFLLDLRQRKAFTPSTGGLCVPSNVEVVRRGSTLIREYLSGETDAAERRLPHLFSRDAVLVPSSALPSGSVGPYHGPEGVLSWLAAVRARWSRFEIHGAQFVEAPPDKVVVLAQASARRPDGRGYAGTFGEVWELCNGRVVAATAFQSQVLALEHAGLEPGRLAGRASPRQA
jgi:ketosteroid isomerase-like protein